MKKKYLLGKIKNHSKKAVFSLLLLFSLFGHAQTNSIITIPSDLLINNKGVLPQTLANGMKPYDLIYNLYKNNNTPVDLVLKALKVGDLVHFHHMTI